MRSLATATAIRGFDHSHILARIFCHSSVVKVQRSGHDSPRRRAPMIGVCGHGVKPDDAPSRDADSCWRHLVGGNGREYYWPFEIPVKRPLPAPEIARQNGLVSTSRMNAAPLSQDSSASSADGSTDSGPTRTR